MTAWPLPYPHTTAAWAGRQGYGFTVLDVPPYPVSRRRGGMEEISHYPGGREPRGASGRFCERCVFSFPMVSGCLPTRPRPRTCMIWRMANGSIRVLAKLLHEVQLEIRNCFEIRR